MHRLFATQQREHTGTHLKPTVTNSKHYVWIVVKPWFINLTCTAYRIFRRHKFCVCECVQCVLAFWPLQFFFYSIHKICIQPSSNHTQKHTHILVHIQFNLICSKSLTTGIHYLRSGEYGEKSIKKWATTTTTFIRVQTMTMTAIPSQKLYWQSSLKLDFSGQTFSKLKRTYCAVLMPSFCINGLVVYFMLRYFYLPSIVIAICVGFASFIFVERISVH